MLVFLRDLKLFLLKLPITTTQPPLPPSVDKPAAIDPIKIIIISVNVIEIPYNCKVKIEAAANSAMSAWISIPIKSGIEEPILFLSKPSFFAIVLINEGIATIFFAINDSIIGSLSALNILINDFFK